MTGNKQAVNIPEGMSLQAHYSVLMRAAIGFRESIQEHLQISRRTFFDRIKDASWTPLERRLLSEYFEAPEEILFPENEAIDA